MSDSNLAKIREYGEKGKAKKIIPFVSNKHPQVRAEAAKALGNAKGEESYNKLILLLEDPDLEVRKSAAEALGVYGDEKAIEHLRHAMHKESDPAFQEIARHAMGAIPRKA